jgi:hypothetical protein
MYSVKISSFLDGLEQNERQVPHGQLSHGQVPHGQVPQGQHESFICANSVEFLLLCLMTFFDCVRYEAVMCTGSTKLLTAWRNIALAYS